MSISGDDLTRGHSVGNVLADVVLGPGISVLLNESEDIVEALLVSKTMERSSESIETG